MSTQLRPASVAAAAVREDEMEGPWLSAGLQTAEGTREGVLQRGERLPRAAQHRAGTRSGRRRQGRGLDPCAVTLLLSKCIFNPNIPSEKGGRKIISSNFIKWFTGHVFPF